MTMKPYVDRKFDREGIPVKRFTVETDSLVEGGVRIAIKGQTVGYVDHYLDADDVRRLMVWLTEHDKENG